MSFDNELTRFEEQLAMQFRGHAPDGMFVEELKSQLKGSRLFKQRREIGANLVGSLAVLLSGVIAFTLYNHFDKAKKKQSIKLLNER